MFIDDGTGSAIAWLSTQSSCMRFSVIVYLIQFQDVIDGETVKLYHMKSNPLDAAYGEFQQKFDSMLEVYAVVWCTSYVYIYRKIVVLLNESVNSNVVVAIVVTSMRLALRRINDYVYELTNWNEIVMLAIWRYALTIDLPTLSINARSMVVVYLLIIISIIFSTQRSYSSNGKGNAKAKRDSRSGGKTISWNVRSTHWLSVENERRSIIWSGEHFRCWQFLSI